MKTALAIGLGLFGVVIIVSVLLGFGYIGFSNTTHQFENSITATYTNNKNVVPTAACKSRRHRRSRTSMEIGKPTKWGNGRSRKTRRRYR